MPNGIDFSVDDPDQQESQMPVYDPYQIEAQSGGPETPREFLGPPALQKPILGIYGVPEDIHGTPGIGVVGPQRFRVGIQAPQTLAQYEALRASQGPRTVQEANLIANQAAQEANFQRQLMQSAKVEDAAKAIAASRRYIAMRKLARDWQTGKAAGLSDEQSWV